MSETRFSNRDIGVTERTFHLCCREGRYQWVFDDNDEILNGLAFESKEAAANYMYEKTSRCRITRTKLTPQPK